MSYIAYKSYMTYTSYFEENTVYNSQLYKIILNLKKSLYSHYNSKKSFAGYV